MAGVISDHLLLSVLDDYDDPLPDYEALRKEDQQVIDALRAGGIIHLATWAPADGLHAGKNIGNLVSHYRQKTDLDYSGFDRVSSRLPETARCTRARSW